MNESYDRPGELIFSLLVLLAGVVFAFVWARKRVRQLHESWVEEAELLAEMRGPFDRSQPWREKTDIRFLEDLQLELLAKEKALIEAKPMAVAFLIRRKRGSTERVLAELFRARHVLGFYKRRSYLCQRLDLLWAGDAHLEIEDRKDSILKLKRELGDLSAKQTSSRHQIDVKIITLERELRDLDAIVLRATKRAKVSPHQVEYQRAQEIHELDTKATIHRTFEGSLSQMEIYREQATLVAQVNADPTFTEEQKKRLKAQIVEDAKAADKNNAPARQSKPGSIYKAGD